MSLFLAILGVSFVIGITYHIWSHMNEDRIALGRKFFGAWLCKGLGFPLLIWGLINAGLWPGVTSFVPEVALDLPGWSLPWKRFMSQSLWLIVTYWSGLTFAWMVGLNLAATSERADSAVVVVVTALLASPVAVYFVYLGAWGAGGLATMVLMAPGAYLTCSMVSSVLPVPSYSKAVARMKRGKFEEAEWEVIRELEKFEGDFEGWMMLAEIYARQFRDLEAAEQTVVELCAQPEINVAQRAVALHRLADWHLELEGDPSAARMALEAICAKAPGSHLDLMARQRIEQLPQTREEWMDRKEHAAIPLPLDDPKTEAGESAASSAALDSETAQARIELCLVKLEENPNDMDAREELAELWVIHGKRDAEAIEQVDLLMGMPEYPEAQKPVLLGRLVSWLEFKGQNPQALQACRHRLIREFPRSREAFIAQKRLNLDDFQGD